MDVLGRFFVRDYPRFSIAIQKESLYLHHDSMSTVRDKRLTHVEKPKQSTLFQTNKVLCFLVLPDVMLAQGKPLRRSTLYKLWRGGHFG